MLSLILRSFPTHRYTPRMVKVLWLEPTYSRNSLLINLISTKISGWLVLPQRPLVPQTSGLLLTYTPVKSW